VVIAVPVAAADRRRSKLQEPHDHYDGYQTKDQVNHSSGRVGLKILPPTGFGRNRGPLNRNSGLRILLYDFVHYLLREAQKDKKKK
jgi:hypothetical protein